MTKWINADEQLPLDQQWCVVYITGLNDPMIGRAAVYGREDEPKQGRWFVRDGRGGYYPGDYDDSDYSMKGTWWYPVLLPLPK